VASTEENMVFNEWLELSPSEREAEKENWHVFEAGYWHALAHEAASRFAGEFATTKGVRRICKSLYRSEELIIAVQTDAAPDKLLPLPETYLGFRVLQFAGKTPEGVLVDVTPPAGVAAARKV
jgi:hypothetical protein